MREDGMPTATQLKVAPGCPGIRPAPALGRMGVPSCTPAVQSIPRAGPGDLIDRLQLFSASSRLRPLRYHGPVIALARAPRAGDEIGLVKARAEHRAPPTSQAGCHHHRLTATPMPACRAPTASASSLRSRRRCRRPAHEAARHDAELIEGTRLAPAASRPLRHASTRVRSCRSRSTYSRGKTGYYRSPR